MKKLLPVIHIESPEQTLRNTSIAKEAGCEGVFLIDHMGDHVYLMDTYIVVRQQFPDMWVGINDLGRRNQDVFYDLQDWSSVNGLWIDNLGVDEDDESQEDLIAMLGVLDSKWSIMDGGLVFGGVAFKYQKPVRDVAKAARIAKDYCDVVTTSGEGTGSAPTLEKIRTMKEAIGDKPLAIASGISVENVGQFLEFTDYFLVATGISKTFNELDPEKTKQLLDLIKSH